MWDDILFFLDEKTPCFERNQYSQTKDIIDA